MMKLQQLPSPLTRRDGDGHVGEMRQLCLLGATDSSLRI